MEEIAKPVLESIGLDVDLYSTLGNLAISDQQLIELARVIIERPKLLRSCIDGPVMDGERVIWNSSRKIPEGTWGS